MKRIGVISDTHGLLRPEAISALRGCELILHAGDIGSQGVIDRLEEISKVVAISGNVDHGELAQRYAPEEVVELEGKYIYMLHNIQEIDLDPVAAGFDIVISGHSHRPKKEIKNDVLYLNPGSAGPRRFTLPITLAIMTIGDGRMDVEIRELPD